MTAAAASADRGDNHRGYGDRGHGFGGCGMGYGGFGGCGMGYGGFGMNYPFYPPINIIV